MFEEEKIFIDQLEYQQKLLEFLTSEEFDRFFNVTVFKDNLECRQAMIHGMAIASMMTSQCKHIAVKDREREVKNMATEFIVLNETETLAIVKNGMVTCRMDDGRKLAITTEEGFKKWCDNDKPMCLVPGEE